jgi:cytidylate kinase
MIAIAIDGPSGAGKSTVARRLAKELGFLYVDTGAMYRAIGLRALRDHVDLHDEKQVQKLLSGIQIRLESQNGTQHIFLNEEDVSDEIRSPEVSMAASNVSALPKVRMFLLETQRAFARQSDVIMDGRDIGTVVLPCAQVKIFLTASPEERAERRFRELQEKGISCTYDTVLAETKQRDAQDANRAVAPLRPAEDAAIVDTTGCSLEQAVAMLKQTIKERLG